MKDIGVTVDYLQDADLVLGVNRTEEMKLAAQNQLVTLAARECQNVTVVFNWHFGDMNFDQTMGEIEGEDTVETGSGKEKTSKEIDF